MRKMLMVLAVVVAVAVVWWRLADSLEAQAAGTTWSLQFVGFLGAAAIALVVRAVYPKIWR